MSLTVSLLAKSRTDNVQKCLIIRDADYRQQFSAAQNKIRKIVISHENTSLELDSRAKP